MSSVASSSSTPFQNIYYERKAGTERPCYICRRPTSTVLATFKTEDFLYTCEGHLTDPGFASPISPPPTPNGPSAEEIRKVIADYNAREAKKATKDKDDKVDSKDKDKDKAKEKDKDKDKDKDRASPDLSNVPNLPVSTSPPASTHRKFALHRQIFDMRRAEIRRKEQGVKAKEVSKGLPQVPRGAF